MLNWHSARASALTTPEIRNKTKWIGIDSVHFSEFYSLIHVVVFFHSQFLLLLLLLSSVLVCLLSFPMWSFSCIVQPTTNNQFVFPFCAIVSYRTPTFRVWVSVSVCLCLCPCVCVSLIWCAFPFYIVYFLLIFFFHHINPRMERDEERQLS